MSTESTDTILRAIHAAHVRLTLRDSKYQVHEPAVWQFHSMGFSAEDMEVVCKFLLRENSRNHFKHNLSFGRLVSDLQRFDDLLSEARSKLRNTVKPATPREVALTQLRGPATTETETGTARRISEFLKTPQ